MNNKHFTKHTENINIDSFNPKASGNGKLVKLTMVDWESQGLTVNQQFNESREYHRTPDPAERLEEGEEFTLIDIDARVNTDYNFKFKLTNRTDEPISNAIVWMHIGFMPKTINKFFDDNYNEQYEALGTGPFVNQGPGILPNRMFGRPLIYSAAGGEDSYGPYFWKYSMTDENGIASFNVNFNHSYTQNFAECFGTGHGGGSIEDTLLYLRVICANFSWSNFTISNPDQYICSSSKNVFNGSCIIDDYDFTELENLNTTYIEGIIQLHHVEIRLVLRERVNAKFPTSADDCEDILVHIDIMRADIPSISVLDPKYWDGNSFRANYILYNPGGVEVLDHYSIINPSSKGGGFMYFSRHTMQYSYKELGPGVSTLKVYIQTSENYAASPILNIPFELYPPNNSTFNRKRNYSLDLANPFITAWGSCYEKGNVMPFESNFPYLIGTFWFKPDFSGIGVNKERSFQDYIKMYLLCTIYNEDGTTKELALRECSMLRPGNYDGIISFMVGFGPEDSFLMDKNCSYRLIFNADYNSAQVLKENRELILYLLDLRIIDNPSCLNEKVIWSLYDDQFSSANININRESNTISSLTETISIGSEDNEYGVEVTYKYLSGKNSYSLKETDDLLSLGSLSSLEPIAVIGNNGIIGDHRFEKGIDWKAHNNPVTLQDYSTVNFTGETPVDNSDFKVVYKFNFNFVNKYYGCVSFNGPSSDNILYSWIDFVLPIDYMNSSQNVLSPMYVKYKEELIAGSQIYQLSYGLDGISSWDDNFIIYNENELNLFTKSVSSEGFPILTFSTIQTNDFNITYGIKSQYDLGYGFQKKNGWHSDSIRTICNNKNNFNAIINSSQVQINTSTIKNPSVYISLDDCDNQKTLELNNIPIYYDPSLNFTFRLDPIILDQINKFGQFNKLRISFNVKGMYSSFDFSDFIEINLDYNTLKNNLEQDGGYLIKYNINLFLAFQSIDSDYLNVNISVSQVGLNNNYIPYIILEKFEYEHNSLFIMTDNRMPRTPQAELDVEEVIYTGHHIQLFSNIYGDIPAYTMYNAYFPFPFEPSNNSKITVTIDGIPNATLVSLYIPTEYNWNYNYLGRNETLIINETSCYMVTNLALFLDFYYVNKLTNQSGFINIYNGTNTSELDRIDRKHLYFLIYEYSKPVPSFLNSILNYCTNNWNVEFRKGYRDFYKNTVLWPNDYTLTINEVYDEISNQRSTLQDYTEPFDIVAPIISIVKPLQNATFYENSPIFELSILQSNLETLWYIINNLTYSNLCGITGQINQTTWTSLGFGKHIIRFYAVDKLGIITYYEIIIYKSTSILNTPSSSGSGGGGGSGSDKDSEINPIVIFTIVGVSSVALIGTIILIIHLKKKGL